MTEETPILMEDDGVTVRCAGRDGGTHWMITRTSAASAEAIARAVDLVPNPTGFRMDFPINGEFTYEFFCPN